MLDFRPLTIEDKSFIDDYMYRYGENSCQHSFASMFCLVGKYGDQVCEKNGWLFVLRTKKCDDNSRIYLFPMGNYDDEDQCIMAIQEVLDDAHAYGCKAIFDTATERSVSLLNALFPSRFSAIDNRDYAEYIYTRAKLLELPGRHLSAKRNAIRAFYRDYGDTMTVKEISQDILPEIRAFQTRWLEEKQTIEEVSLVEEDIAVEIALNHYGDLGLFGIAVYIDETIAGYAYGSQISTNGFDVMVEKGDSAVKNIYRVLNQILVDRSKPCLEYFNREEDIGEPGLRKAKLSYHPDILLKKYVVYENV